MPPIIFKYQLKPSYKSPRYHFAHIVEVRRKEVKCTDFLCAIAEILFGKYQLMEYLIQEEDEFVEAARKERREEGEDERKSLKAAMSIRDSAVQRKRKNRIVKNNNGSNSRKTKGRRARGVKESLFRCDPNRE